MNIEETVNVPETSGRTSTWSADDDKAHWLYRLMTGLALLDATVLYALIAVQAIFFGEHVTKFLLSLLLFPVLLCAWSTLYSVVAKGVVPENPFAPFPSWKSLVAYLAVGISVIACVWPILRSNSTITSAHALGGQTSPPIEPKATASPKSMSVLPTDRG